MPLELFIGSCAKLAEFYRVDLPSPESFTSECQTWQVKWQEQSKNHCLASLPDCANDTLPQTTDMYPNIKVLLTILATLSVTTCIAKRSFSTLKRTKTSLCSSMTFSRPTNFTFLHIFRDIEIDLPSTIDEFAHRHPRRMHKSNILNN
uniref:HAT C-terminal dimerisation domain-containing protein n=1 Tax=Amphimedon queenslandica TaxID=400682 RepID=A0A1X7V0J2_AMPQE